MNDVETIDIPSESSPQQGEMGSTVALVTGEESLQVMTSDIVHANLFGSFLICGTLVGIFLFRRFEK